MRIYILILIALAIGCNNEEKKTKEATGSLPISHSFFVAGPNFTGIIDEDGTKRWDSGRKGARDGYILPNGNALICWGNVALELTMDKDTVFQYALDTINSELGTAQRLDNGNTLITELGKQPRILEVDPTGNIALSVPLMPETDNFHMQTRMARKLKNGNYIVPHLLAFAVKEYTKEGSVVRTIATDLQELGGREAENWPFTAIVMDNGNIVINLTHGNKTIITDKDGNVVWKVSNDDFDDQPFKDPCGAQLLPNGNIVIASYASKEGIKLFEVNREKEIVWTYEGPNRAHHFQVLTTNGKPLEGPPMK